MNIAPTINKINLKLRQARLEDIPALTRLIEASVRGLGGRDYSPQQIESSLKYVFGVDTRLIEDGTYFVVESDYHLVGAGGWSRRKTLYGGDQAKGQAEENLLDPRRDSAKIRAFYVHPDWARQGIGRQMMSACEAAAGLAGFTRLELLATLTGAPLYAACGFDVVERVEVKLPDGIVLPTLKMVKQLDQQEEP
ncbi:MAG: GNAT family N-acetyltransferase [Anaerolineae bacterium]|nr:GNAT family N-acetyltransferase [Anaerolineae bacterium]